MHLYRRTLASEVPAALSLAAAAAIASAAVAAAAGKPFGTAACSGPFVLSPPEDGMGACSVCTPPCGSTLRGRHAAAALPLWAALLFKSKPTVAAQQIVDCLLYRLLCAVPPPPIPSPPSYPQLPLSHPAPVIYTHGDHRSLFAPVRLCTIGRVSRSESRRSWSSSRTRGTGATRRR